MTREDLKDKLWKLSALLRELDSKAEHVSRALGLYHKGEEAYIYLENMELGDALAAYNGLTDEQQLKFRVIVNNGESK
jgi:hypothetical protein